MTAVSLLDQAFPLGGDSVRTFRSTGVVHLPEVLDEATVKSCARDGGAVQSVVYSRRLARIATDLLDARSVRLLFDCVDPPQHTDWPLPPQRVCIAWVPLERSLGDVTFRRTSAEWSGPAVVIGYVDADALVTKPETDAQRATMRALMTGAKVGLVPDTASNPVLYRRPIQ